MNIKKIVSMVLSCAVLAVSVLSVGASSANDDYITFGPYYTAKYYGSGTMLYKYTTGIDVSLRSNLTLDGSNSLSKIAVGSTYAKTVETYACIFSGISTTSKFSGNLFDYPATNTTLNKGKIVVSAAANYTDGGVALSTKTSYETSKNWASVTTGSKSTTEDLTSYGGYEYRDYSNNRVMYVYLSNYGY